MFRYRESDVIPCTADDSKEERVREQIREAMVTGIPKRDSPVKSRRQSENESVSNIPLQLELSGKTEPEIIELLTSKLKHLEQQLETEALKCFICMGCYQTPLVSISCWHVCCEECWMRALGTKKECPKCGSIVSSSHLRKIFL